MPYLYFDITDVVNYAWANDRVSGIQRVQVNLIAKLAARHGSDTIRCVFHHPRLGEMFDVDPATLFGNGEFRAADLLQRLSIEKPRRLLAPRRMVRGYLHRNAAGKWVRALKKIDVYSSAVFMPKRLAAMGLAPVRPSMPPLALRPMSSLPQGSAYVILSVNVFSKLVTAFARQHMAQGGELFQLVYDLIAVERPEFFTPSMVQNYREWLDNLTVRKPRVIAISDWTARDLRRYLGHRVAGWDIQSIPLAHEFEGFERGAEVQLAAEDMGILPAEPFILCAGTLEVRKNGDGLLRAWMQVLERLGDRAPLLVFAGKRGWLIEGFFELLDANPALARRVKIVDLPSDRQLAWLYRHCLFSVYPSHYEGWGLPVGESAWFGRYCIASNSSSVPEVCGALMDYVDPRDEEALARAIERALVEPHYVAERERAIEGAPLRSWGDVAEDIFRLVTSPALRERGQAATVGASTAERGTASLAQARAG